jgi:hypothetical protein
VKSSAAVFALGLGDLVDARGQRTEVRRLDASLWQTRRRRTGQKDKHDSCSRRHLISMAEQSVSCRLVA